MNENDKKIGEKIMKFLEFVKKECPGCYKKIQKCCLDDDCRSEK